MFKSFIEIIESILGFKQKRTYLEEYIISNNPESVLDIEYLELDFFRKNTPI